MRPSRVLGTMTIVWSFTPSRIGIITSRLSYSNEFVTGSSLAGVSLGSAAEAPWAWPGATSGDWTWAGGRADLDPPGGEQHDGDQCEPRDERSATGHGGSWTRRGFR